LWTIDISSYLSLALVNAHLSQQFILLISQSIGIKGTMVLLLSQPLRTIVMLKSRKRLNGTGARQNGVAEHSKQAVENC